MDRLTSSLAQALNHAGVSRGQRVGVFLDHCLEQALSFFSILKTGAVYVPMNSQLKSLQADHIARDCRISLLIVDTGRLAMLQDRCQHWDFLKCLIVVGEPPQHPCPAQTEVLLWDDAVESDSAAPIPDQVIGQDLAALLYTSGSTGKPKGVMVSHDNLIAGARIVTSYLENRQDDKLLGVLPLSFDAGLNQLTCSVLLGMTYVMKPFHFPRDIVEVLLKEEITGFAGIPTVWLLLLQLGSPVFKNEFPNLRYITNTGGALPTKAVDTLKKVFPATQIFLMYGLTEAFRSTYLPPSEIENRPTSMGKAIPGVEILVVDKQGLQCGPHEVGELVHRGPTVALGYWGNQDKTREVFRPHPFLSNGLDQTERVVYSGDLVKKDEEGFLYFVARGDHMIKCHGHRISPAEIEEALYKTGKVKLCAAVGIPDPVRGQSIKVFAVPHDGQPLTDDDIFSCCVEQLPNYMLPKYVEVVSDLPRTSSGKIDVATLSRQEVY
jgi:acyl-CoA ligase (AMP-forming) (exosortase A-associated)